jgi:hypothetical protein
MRRYFASEPRLSREELERQAQEAIDARVSMGRPPDEEFAPLHARLAEMDRALAERPPVEREPLKIHQVQVPPAPPSEAEPEVRREPVAASRQSAN